MRHLPHVRRARRAFSLLEIIIVILVMGTLAALAATMYRSMVDQAHAGAAASVAVEVSKAYQANGAATRTIPAAMDAARQPAPGQIPFTDLTYGPDLPQSVTAVAVDSDGRMIVHVDGFSCTGMTFPTAVPGMSPVGHWTCDEV